MPVTFTPGTIVIPNEKTPAQAGIISAVDGHLLTGTASMVESGEGGAMVADGTMIFGQQAASVLTNAVIYNAAIGLVASPNPAFGGTWDRNSPFASDFDSTFYIGFIGGAGVSKVRSVSKTGTLGGTTWSVGTTVGLQALGVDTANTTLFFTGGSSTPMRTFNILTNMAGPDLVASVSGVAWPGRDIIVIPGTNQLLTIVQPANGVLNYEVRRYEFPSGTLLATYPLAFDAFNASAARLSLDLGSPSVAFWTRTFTDPTNATSTVSQVNISTGITVSNFIVDNDSLDPTKAPMSCPFFAWSDNTPVVPRPPWPLVPPFVPAGGPAGTGGLQTVPQRRLRIAPHLSSEQFQIFYDQFTLDLQVGNGILTGQGVNPQIMLRMSDDGGYTWSDEILLDSGAQGQYLTRVTANGLGQARDRVFEISTSDPVSWSIIGAYLNTRKGRW